MPEFQVYLSSYQDATIKVEADDADSAIEEAHNTGIGIICAQCSGWGQKWSRDADSDEWTAYAVSDAEHNEVWTSPSSVVDEAIIRAFQSLRAELDRDPHNPFKLIDSRVSKLRSGRS